MSSRIMPTQSSFNHVHVFIFIPLLEVKNATSVCRKICINLTIMDPILP